MADNNAPPNIPATPIKMDTDMLNASIGLKELVLQA